MKVYWLWLKNRCTQFLFQKFTNIHYSGSCRFVHILGLETRKTQPTDLLFFQITNQISKSCKSKSKLHRQSLQINSKTFSLKFKSKKWFVSNIWVWWFVPQLWYIHIYLHYHNQRAVFIRVDSLRDQCLALIASATTPAQSEFSKKL